MPKSLEQLKDKFLTNYADQSAFAEKARLLQSIWREENNIPVNDNRTVTRKGEVVKAKTYGNYIEPKYAEDTMCNFLTANIQRVVIDELFANEKLTGKDKKVMKKNRLLENLLSSQPLAFNLFAELSLNLNLALNVFQSMFGDNIISISKISFEHSPGRGNAEYTGDHSAFDVFVEYECDKGKGFAGIEVKYSESLNDVPATIKGKKYKEIAETSDVFTVNGLKYLCTMPKSLEQIWRNHLLSLSILQYKDCKYNEGCFVYLYPKDNKECAKAYNDYSNYLKSNNYEETGIYPLEMEKLVDTIRHHTSDEWINDLYERYLNFEKIAKYQNL